MRYKYCTVRYKYCTPGMEYTHVSGALMFGSVRLQTVMQDVDAFFVHTIHNVACVDAIPNHAS